MSEFVAGGIGLNSFAATRERGIELVGATGDRAVRFVTGTLEVRYQRPTPMGPPLIVRGRIAEIKGRKITVELTMTANGETVASGRVIALEAPDSMRPSPESSFASRPHRCES